MSAVETQKQSQKWWQSPWATKPDLFKKGDTNYEVKAGPSLAINTKAKVAGTAGLVGSKLHWSVVAIFYTSIHCTTFALSHMRASHEIPLQMFHAHCSCTLLHCDCRTVHCTCHSGQYQTTHCTEQWVVVQTWNTSMRLCLMALLSLLLLN